MIVLFFGRSAIANSLKSTESIKLISGEAFLFSAMDKTDYYKGQVQRLGATDKELEQADYYEPKVNSIKISKNICASVADKIFNLRNSKYLKMDSFVIFKSNKAKVCEIVVKPIAKTSSSKIKLMHIGFLNAKPIAIVFNLNHLDFKKAMEARQFWNSLR